MPRHSTQTPPRSGCSGSISFLPNPPTFAWKVWWRFQTFGAMTMKNSVQALSAHEKTQEDFEWLQRSHSFPQRGSGKANGTTVCFGVRTPVLTSKKMHQHVVDKVQVGGFELRRYIPEAGCHSHIG